MSWRVRTHGAIVCMVIVGLLVLGVAQSPAQQKAKPRVSDAATPALLQQVANRANSLKAFSWSLRRQALQEAAKAIQEGKTLPYTTTVQVKVTIHGFDAAPWPPLPEMPSKVPEVNVCWEMATSFSSWIECEAQSVIP